MPERRRVAGGIALALLVAIAALLVLRHRSKTSKDSIEVKDPGGGCGGFPPPGHELDPHDALEHDYFGWVVDAEGEPVVGAEIELFGADSGERTLVAIESSFRSDEDGEFVFHAPDYAVLEARHRGHKPGRAQLDHAAQLSHELTITLGVGASKPGKPIVGTLFDAEGVGLEGVEVRVRGAERR